MAYSLVIHSLFTIVGIICAAVCVLQVRSARAFLRGARHHLAAVDDIEERFSDFRRDMDALFGDIEVLQKRHQQNLGRIGALKSAMTPPAPERDDRTIDFEQEDPEREALLRKLAEKRSHG